MPGTDNDIQKEVIKEAIKEWLDDQFAIFGKWVLGSILVLVFTGMVYLALIGMGWKK
jgi:hypothetical protein